MTDFNARAKDWDSDPMKVDRAQTVAQAIRTALPLQPGLTALEIGCGTGLLSFFLQADFSPILPMGCCRFWPPKSPLRASRTCSR